MSGRIDVGVAVSRDALLARPTGPRAIGEEVTASWEVHAPDRAQALAEFFGALRGRFPKGDLHLSLLPPLAEIRLVSLPPLSAEELRVAVASDLRRYAPIGRVAHELQVVPQGDEPSNPRVIATAQGDLVEELLRTASAAGWRVRSLASAIFAWDAAARSNASRADAPWTSVLHDGREDLWRSASGVFTALRRHPRRDGLDRPASDAFALASNDVEALRLAADHAAQPDDRSIWPAREHSARVRRKWRETKVWTAAVGALLALAGLVEWRAQGIALRSVSEERARLRPAVSEAMAARDSLATLQRTLSLIEAFQGAQPRWLAVLAALEGALPDDATLVSLRAAGDTLWISGEAERAAPVLDALAGSPLLQDVRAETAFQQRIEQGEVVAERFLIGARLVSNGEAR